MELEESEEEEEDDVMEVEVEEGEEVFDTVWENVFFYFRSVYSC